MAAESHYSTLDLRQMDREQAREQLTVVEFERWEQLHENIEQAEQTRERFAEEDRQVTELTVHADKESLGTEVELYGNDVLVHIDTEDDTLRSAADALDDVLGETDPEDVGGLSPGETDAVADCLTTMLDTILVRWNGTNWRGIREDTRADVLAECRRKWGVDGLLLAWVDIAAAVREDRQERVDVVESFRTEKRRGRR
jgi:hypothetical protein